MFATKVPQIELLLRNYVGKTLTDLAHSTLLLMVKEYVPHLLKNTRNALIDCGIEFSKQKVAKFEHIEAAFNLDQ
jgi:hypothetical protein